MLDENIIKREIKEAEYLTGFENHIELDKIKIAYEWLDAQKNTKNHQTKSINIKDLVEDWAGTYISRFDVMVAAKIHPKIIGEYPHYNISSRLTKPSLMRIVKYGIKCDSEKRDIFNSETYSKEE